MSVKPGGASKKSEYLRSAPAPEPGRSADPVSTVRKGRSPVERTIVQGAIILLLVVLAVELRAQKGYTSTKNALETLTRAVEEETAMSEVEPLISLFPAHRVVAENGIEKTVEYSWFSFFKNGQYRLNIVSSKSTFPTLPQRKSADAVAESGASQPVSSVAKVPEQMLRFFTATVDPMALTELDPGDIVPLQGGGIAMGDGAIPAGAPVDPPESDPESTQSPDAAKSTPDEVPAPDAEQKTEPAPNP